MKQKYEKPTIESLPFSIEMVEAQVCSDANLPLSYATHATYPSPDCTGCGIAIDLS